MIGPDGMQESMPELCEKATLYLLRYPQLPRRSCLPRLASEFAIGFVSNATFQKQWFGFFHPESMMNTKTAVYIAFPIQMVIRMNCVSVIVENMKPSVMHLSCICH